MRTLYLKRLRFKLKRWYLCCTFAPSFYKSSGHVMENHLYLHILKTCASAVKTLICQRWWEERQNNEQPLTSSASQWCSSPTLQHLQREQKQAEVKNTLPLAEKCKQAAKRGCLTSGLLSCSPPFTSQPQLQLCNRSQPSFSSWTSSCSLTALTYKDSALSVITLFVVSNGNTEVSQLTGNILTIFLQRKKKPSAILFHSFYFKTSHFITVNILMETSCTDRIWAFLIHRYVYSSSLRRPERAHLPQGI